MRSIIPRFRNPSPSSPFIEGLWELLLPRPCVSCGQSRKGGGPCLCSPCREELNLIDPPVCDQCGVPAEIDYSYPTESFLCARCRKGPIHFDRARSLGTYESVFRGLIKFYKYQCQPGALDEVYPLLVDFFADRAVFYADFMVVPVPLHVWKLKERGFDQACLLAREVARVLQRPLAPGVLERIRPTPTQTRLSRNQRIENVRGAFRVLTPEEIQGRSVLLVDDVMTTGATVNEVSKTLKDSGAERVDVFTLGLAA